MSEEEKVYKEAIKVLIENNKEEFECLLFQKKRELELFGEFVK